MVTSPLKPRRGCAGLLSCVSYGFVSTSITLFNKAIFSVYGFHYPAFVTVAQVGLSLLILTVLRFSGTLDFGPRMTWSAIRYSFPLALLWMIYVQSGVMALRHLNVPMFAALRRTTIVVTAFGQWAFLRKETSLPCLCSIACMLAGAIVAGATDLSFSFAGYAWLSICIFSTAGYLILISYLGDRMKMNQHAMLFYNNLVSFPMMLAWLWFATDEPATLLGAPQLRSGNFLLFLFASSSQAFLLNMCIFWCTTENSPMATTVTGQIKDILTTSLGLFLYGDVLMSRENLIGLAMGLAGGFAYSLISLGEREKTANASFAERDKAANKTSFAEREKAADTAFSFKGAENALAHSKDSIHSRDEKTKSKRGR